MKAAPRPVPIDHNQVLIDMDRPSPPEGEEDRKVSRIAQAQVRAPAAPVETPGPVLTRHPGLALLALAVGGFAIGTTEFSAMSLLPDFAGGLGVDAPTAGHVISAYALGVVVGAPVIAVMGARLARRSLLIGLMLFFAIANGFSAVAPSFDWLAAFRFLSGLPHGAYFGVASLVAGSLVPPQRRAQAVARVLLGLTIATVLGVPMANAVGQWIGWRWAFAIVAGLAATTALLIFTFAPHDRPEFGASPLRELGAFRRPQVLLTLAIGAVGFGGMFAVYAYLASTLTQTTHVAPVVIPLVLTVFGLGLTAGNLAGGWFADRAVMPTVGGMLALSTAALALYPFAADDLWAIGSVVFLVGCGGGLAAALQTRLMDVAGDAQTLAAALNHSALNMANALGPWLGGLAIAAGYGWPSTGWVGSGLALGGLAIWLVSLAASRSAGRVRLTAPGRSG